MRAWWKWIALALAISFAIAVPSAAFAQGEDSYVVASGDALETIADRFGTTVGELVRLNGLVNPDRIKAGQQLLVPAVASSASPLPTGFSSARPLYAVAAGDTLEQIAETFGTTVLDLLAVNRLANPHFLAEGQRLVLPSPRVIAPRGGPRVEESEDPVQSNNPVVAALKVPYRSQYDGSTYGDSNCGPATLGMLMGYVDEWWTTSGIRRDVNTITGDWSEDGGSSWESLAYAARKRGFGVVGLYEGKDYRHWTLDELMIEVRNERPPMLLVRYRNLPGHEGSTWWGDHYIVFLGLTADGDVIYHDSAFHGSAGAYRIMSPKQLMRAWSTNAAGIQYSAMVLQWP